MNHEREQLSRLGNVSIHHTNEQEHELVALEVDAFIAAAWPGTQVEPKTRAYRFLEEAIEINQTIGITREKAHELVDHVYNKPVGELYQEAGGVAFTFTALLNALDFDYIKTTRDSVEEAWGRIDKIREKSKTKPKAV